MVNGVLGREEKMNKGKESHGEFDLGPRLVKALLPKMNL